MSKEKIWLSSPTMHGEEMRYMKEAYDTNWMSTIGANLDAIEKEIAEYTGNKYAVALASGTSAIHLAIKLAGVQAGDKVACSDMTFAATVNPVVYEKAVPVLIDSEYDTWNMDPEALDRAFSLHPDIKLIDVAHLYGTPAKMDEIKAIADKHDVAILEDAAESLGATYKEKKTGCLGKYNCISFNGNKIITGSSGGMYLTDSKEDADRIRKWSTQSRDNAPWYQHTELGYNYRMSNVIAGVVRGQMLHLDEHVARKKAIYDRYREGLSDLPLSMNPYDSENSCPNFWLSCILIDRGVDIDPIKIMEKLAENNIESRPIWKPMHLQPIYEKVPFVSIEDGVDVGADIFSRGLCLPSDIKMTEGQQEEVINIIKGFF